MRHITGWDSDGDDDKAKPDDAPPADSEPAYVPPRKMDLLDLDTAGDRAGRTSYHITKLPNLVGINYHPYDRRTHDPEAEEDHYRGYVHNMVRWRYREDDDGEYVRDKVSGEPVRESNTRLVKWSDGSYTLHVGREVLEVDDLDGGAAPTAGDGGFAGPKGYLYVSQKARVTPPTERELKGPLGEGEVDDGPAPEPRPAGTVLECLGPVSSRFAPRPSSLASDAHRNLTLAVRQRNVKRARIAEFVTEHDPEAEKRARIKGTDDLARSKNRKGRGGGGGGRKKMSKSYLEDDDEDGEYETVNVKRIKKKAFLADDDEELDYGESSDEEDEWEEEKKRRPGSRASGRNKREEEESDSDEDGEVVFGESSDEEDAPAKKAKPAKKSAAAVFGDDDDDD